MSDIGVYAGIYTQIDSLARLLDDVLVGLKSGDSKPSDDARRQLCEMLMEMGRDTDVDLAEKRLGILLREGAISNKMVWTRMGCELQETNVDPSLTTRLEAFANVVENKRTKTLASMRGQPR